MISHKHTSCNQFHWETKTSWSKSHRIKTNRAKNSNWSILLIMIILRRKSSRLLKTNSCLEKIQKSNLIIIIRPFSWWGLFHQQIRESTLNQYTNIYPYLAQLTSNHNVKWLITVLLKLQTTGAKALMTTLKVQEMQL